MPKPTPLSSLVVLLVACGTVAPIQPRPIPASDPKWCEPAEKRLVELKCPWARNADGVGFAALCRERLENGVDLHGECIANDAEAKTCDDFRWVCGCAKTDAPCRAELQKK